MLLDNIAHFLNGVLRQRRNDGSRQRGSQQALAVPKPIGFNDFLAFDMPPREMLLDPILPERSLAMLYAPRGVGKTLLSSFDWTSSCRRFPLLRWSHLGKDVFSMSTAKCRSSRYRNDFERFQWVLVPSFRMMDFEFWRQTIPKTVSQSVRKKDNGRLIHC